MTQIISVITQEYALLVSDRRLTYADGPLAGKVFSDDECKLVSLCNTCGIGYSGLSKLGGRPTHEWIATTLAEADCRDANKATQALVDMTLPALPSANSELRRQTFIVAGWAHFDGLSGLRSHICVVTNMLDEDGRVLPQALDRFERRARALRDEEVLLWRSIWPLRPERARALERNLRRLVERDIGPTQALRLLVDEILFEHRSASPPTVGDRILGFCIPRISVERQLKTGETEMQARLPNEESVAFTYFDPAYSELRQYGPTFICGRFAASDIQTEHDPTRGFQSSQMKILNLPQRNPNSPL